jgi:hypothetical protein
VLPGFRVAALSLFAAFGFVSMAVGEVVTLFTEGFESDGAGTRYTVINPTDDGNNDYFARRPEGSTGTSVRGGTLQGNWFWAAQDLDGDGVAVPPWEDNEGLVTWNDAIVITDLGNFRITAAVAQGGDEQEFDNPLALQYRFDGGEWLTAGGFRGLHTNSPSYYFEGGNFERTQGTVPSNLGPRLTRTFQDFSWSIPGTGDTLEIRLFINANGGSEQYGIDNIRVTGDDAVVLFDAALSATEFDEDAGAAAGSLTVTLPEAATSDVVFDIEVSDINMSEVDMPETVTVLSGQTEGTVSFDILEDGRYDGNEPVIVLVSSDGYATERLLFTVNNLDPLQKVVINEVGTVQIGANCADTEDPVQDTNGDGVCLEDEEEFMEIVNIESFPVNIGNMELWDERGTRHIFKNGTILQPGQAAVVFGGGQTRGAYGGSIAERNSQGNFSFDEDGESTSIRAGSANEAGALVDEYTYDTSEGSTGHSFNRNEKVSAPGEYWIPVAIDHDNNPATADIGGPTDRYVDHAAIAAANGAFFSPGFQADGSPFLAYDDVLTVTAAADVVAEGATVVGTISVENAAPAGGIEVIVAATRNTAEATMVNLVTIPEGATEANFDIMGVDDMKLDGDREIEIRAVADGLLPGVGYVTVVDIAEDPFSVVINEVFPDVLGTGTDANTNGLVEEPLEDQFIEIVNTGDEAVNLTGWRLITDRTDQPEPPLTVHNFSGTILKPGGSVIVFGGGDEVLLQKKSFGQFGRAIIHVANGSFNGVNLTDDGAARATLETPDGYVEDEVRYSSNLAEVNSSLVRSPELTGDLAVHLDLSTALFLFDSFTVGTALDRTPFAGNGITTAQVLGGGANPIPELQDWYTSPWLGSFNTTQEPWAFTDAHGFVYHDPNSVTDDSLFFYDPTMVSWWWTNAAIYPYMYAFDPGPDNQAVDVGANWLFYFDDNVDPRFFAVIGTTTFLEYGKTN